LGLSFRKYHEDGVHYSWTFTSWMFVYWMSKLLSKNQLNLINLLFNSTIPLFIHLYNSFENYNHHCSIINTTIPKN
jgi:hypothetical protein